MTSWSRREFLGRTMAAVAFAAGAGGLLAACDSSSESSEQDLGNLAGSPDKPVTLPVSGDNPPLADGLGAEDGTLQILNFADYISDDVIKAFEDAHQVDVQVATFDTDDEAVQLLEAGQVKPDLFLSASSNSLPKLVAAKLIRPLNHTYLTNFANILPAFQDPFYDQGSRYSVPYTVFGTGILYRTDKVDPSRIEQAGWNIFWDPAFKGQVTILDDKREGIALAMLRKGISDVNTTDPKVIAQAGADLKELASTMDVRVSIEGYRDVPQGGAAIAHAWSGDPVAGVANYLPEGVDPSVIGWWYPADRRSVVNNDLQVVLKDAPHPVLAHLFIDHLLNRDNALLNYAWNGYQPPLDGIDRTTAVDQDIVPDSLKSAVLDAGDIASGLRLLYVAPKVEAMYDAAWTGFTAAT